MNTIVLALLLALALFSWHVNKQLLNYYYYYFYFFYFFFSWRYNPHWGLYFTAL